MEVLNLQEEAEEEERYQQELSLMEEEAAKSKGRLLNYSGNLEKKSPAHNLWQRRFFKLSSRETDNPDKPYIYSLIWYKKEGGSAIKALEADKIDYVCVTSCPRALVFIPPPDSKSGLWLQSEAGGHPWAVPVHELSGEDEKANKAQAAGTEFYVFTVMQTDGKEHILRGSKIDRVIRWINILAQAANLAYDSKSRTWHRGVVDWYLQQASDRAAMPSVFNVPSPVSSPAGKRIIFR